MIELTEVFSPIPRVWKTRRVFTVITGIHSIAESDLPPAKTEIVYTDGKGLRVEEDIDEVIRRLTKGTVTS